MSSWLIVILLVIIPLWIYFLAWVLIDHAILKIGIAGRFLIDEYFRKQVETCATISRMRDNSKSN